MRIVMFYHSLVSDWNHGNAHFLRGIVSELLRRGHDVEVFEPEDGWSRQNLLAEGGPEAVADFHRAYPGLSSTMYDLSDLDLDSALAGADLVLMHEWNDHELVRKVGQHRAGDGRCRLLFHDTHHRAVTDPQAMAEYDLRHYDGVLAFGEVLRQIYQARGWAARARTWHEAADTAVFTPHRSQECDGDLVWIGNWGDEERTEELREFLIRPVRELGLRASIYGVRYPAAAIRELEVAGISYKGWLPNYRVPEVFSRHLFTVHVPRRPYADSLPGIPTIRPFEALACGIPLISAPWDDAEGLFSRDRDYLVAAGSAEMKGHMKALLENDDLRTSLSANGLKTIRDRHTCSHRVDELMAIFAELSSASDTTSIGTGSLA